VARSSLRGLLRENEAETFAMAATSENKHLLPRGAVQLQLAHEIARGMGYIRAAVVLQ